MGVSFFVLFLIYEQLERLMYDLPKKSAGQKEQWEEYRLNRGFPKVDHLGRSARIVLEQNEFSKKWYLWQDLNSRPWDCLVLTFPLMPYPCASPPLLGRLRL